MTIHRFVRPEWRARAEAAQADTTIMLIDGVYRRLRYGSEPYFGNAWPATCPDCAAARGTFHVFGCSHERCPRCGGQAIGCPTCTPLGEDDEVAANDEGSP